MTVKVKVKNAVVLRMELISLSQSIEPVGGYTNESVTHGQCEARPTVTFPANDRYQFILLGEQRHKMTVTMNK